MYSLNIFSDMWNKGNTIAALMVLGALSVSAQAGFKIGTNLANVDEDNLYVKSKFLPRLQLGFAFGPIKLSKKTNITTELLTTWKGQHVLYEETFELVQTQRIVKSDYKDKFTYLEMPVLIATKATDRLTVQFGAIVGMRLSGVKKGKTTISVYDRTAKTTNDQQYSEDSKYSDKDKYPSGAEGLFNRPVRILEAGLAVGATYRFTNKVAFYGRYYHGLTDVFNNHYPFKNASSSRELNRGIQFGVLFLFKSSE